MLLPLHSFVCRYVEIHEDLYHNSRIWLSRHAKDFFLMSGYCVLQVACFVQSSCLLSERVLLSRWQEYAISPFLPLWFYAERFFYILAFCRSSQFSTSGAST